jgi:hypothetical protein
MWDEFYKPNIRGDIQYRELEDGGVLYDTSAERIHTLNVTAAYIWNCCDGFHNLSQIASELHWQVDVPRERALKDVREVLAYFQNEGLLRLQ